MATNNCVEHIWELHNFGSLEDAKYSADFDIKENGFYLCLHAKSSVHIFEEYAQIQIHQNPPYKNLRVQCKISLLNKYNEKCLTDESLAIFERNTPEKGGIFMIKNEYVLNPKNALLTNGKLRIHCEVNVLDNESFQNKTIFNIGESEIQNETLKALEDYESLLESCKHSDVVFVVGKKELKLHKAILSARSPVFAAMFDFELVESKKNRVEIIDVEAEVFEELVRFIYTGKIPSLDQYAWELFVVSDKYQLDSLKNLCEKFLTANLTVESVTKVLTLADMHNAAKLKANCVDYVTEHSSAVMSSEGWKQMVKQRIELVIELYQRITFKYENKRKLDSS